MSCNLTEEFENFPDERRKYIEAKYGAYLIDDGIQKMIPMTYEESKECEMRDAITEEESLRTLIGDLIINIKKKHC